MPNARASELYPPTLRYPLQISAYLESVKVTPPHYEVNTLNDALTMSLFNRDVQHEIILPYLPSCKLAIDTTSWEIS